MADKDRIRLHEYLEVLSSRHIRSALFFSALARFPIAMISLSLLLYVNAITGSFSQASRASGALLLGTAVGAVVQGRMIDRAGPQKPLMIAASLFVLCATSLTLTVQSGGHGPEKAMAVAALAFGTGICQPNVSAASRAIWGLIVQGRAAITVGSSYEALSLQAFFALGPGLSGVLAIGAWPTAGFLVAYAMMAAGTAGFCVTRPVRDWPRPEPSKAGTFRFIGALRSPGLRTLLLAAGAVGLGLGGVEVALPAAMSAAAVATGYAGVLLSGWTVTSLLFAFWYGPRPWPGPVPARVPTLLAGFFALIGLIAVPRTLLGVSIATLAAGCMIGVQTATHSVTLHIAVPGSAIAEGFAWLLTGLTLGASVGQTFSGFLVDHVGTHATFAVLALVGLALAALVALRSATLRLSVPGR